MKILDLADATTITPQQAFEALRNNHQGLFWRATFVKADGTIRNMVCRRGVTKNQSGGKMTYDPDSVGNVVVWDVEQGSYRTIKIQRLIGFKFAGMTFKVKNG